MCTMWGALALTALHVPGDVGKMQGGMGSRWPECMMACVVLVVKHVSSIHFPGKKNVLQVVVLMHSCQVNSTHPFTIEHLLGKF